MNEQDIKPGKTYWMSISGKRKQVAVLGCKRTADGLRFEVTTLGKSGVVLPERVDANALSEVR